MKIYYSIFLMVKLLMSKIILTKHLPLLLFIGLAYWGCVGSVMIKYISCVLFIAFLFGQLSGKPKRNYVVSERYSDGLESLALYG